MPKKKDRIGRLKARFAFDPPHEVCFERAIAMTRSYRTTEGEPSAIRQAKAFYEVLENQTLFIQNDERIVGNIASVPRAAYFAPEIFTGWEHYQKGASCVMKDSRFSSGTDIGYQIPEEVADYWKRRPTGNPVGHFVPNYEVVLRKGFLGLLAEVHERKTGADPQQKIFYESAEIACRAAIRFAERHADYAQTLAEAEENEGRRAALLRISENCRKVPAHPAESFEEALQAFWLTHGMLHIQSKDWSISPGRFDQYLFPYYERDIREGRMTREDAAELLGCLWIKFNEVRMDVDFISYQNVLLGGVDRQGHDATNDLSYLCLEVTERIRMIQPSLSVRVHDGMPKSFLEKAAAVVKNGGGLPAFFGDETNIASLMEVGISLEDARDYAIAGCEEVAVQGKTHGALRGGIFSQAQCLLFALFDGCYPGSEEPAAPRTGDASLFTSFGQVLDAYKTQLKFQTEKAMERSLRLDETAMKVTPYPFVSLLFDGCLESGRDITAGGAAHNLTTIAEAGTMTAADSLYAIKVAVFEKKAFTMAQVTGALQKNFEGYEPLRQYLLKKIPKFGNDLDEVDCFCAGIAELNETVIRELDRRNFYGGKFATGSGLSNAFMLGQWVGATPDGRKAGEHLSVSFGPSHGRDTNGPTATLNSVAKINFSKQVGGTLTHLRLHPQTIAGDAGTVHLAGTIAAFFKKGGMGLHLSIVGKELLEAARREPDKHRDVIVRIGGYSVYYTLLSDAFQQELINRTEH